MAVVRSHQPLLQSDFLFKFSKTGRLFKRYLEVLHSFTRNVSRNNDLCKTLNCFFGFIQVIRERKDALRLNNKAASELTEDDLLLGKKKRLAFLDLLIEASKDGTLMTDQELQEEVDTFMFGVCTRKMPFARCDFMIFL